MFNCVSIKRKQMSFVSNGGKFKLYTVLNGLLFSTPTQPRISFERAILLSTCTVLSKVTADVKNITGKESYIIVQIPDTKTNVRREFTISLLGNFECVSTMFVQRMQYCCNTYYIINNIIADFHLFHFS
jgi:hypothetical protein